MTDHFLIAAASVLLGVTPIAGVPQVERPIADSIDCQLSNPPAPAPGPVSGQMNPHTMAGNHVSVRWRADPPSRRVHHHRHCQRWGRGWRCHS